MATNLVKDIGALDWIPEPLLSWYDKNKRAMAWRDNPEPYWVWISEIMLQQTRVEAVRDYFDRFLAALPTIRDLAEAEEGALLKLWEGLGYYSRAYNLQKAARVVCERYGGELPANYGDLLALPGIGEYTAGAIASIAFGLRYPVVDGNVYRVITRLLACGADVTAAATKKAMREGMASLVPEHRPGDFNQAVMELGATICLPNGAPQCLLCPLGPGCAAHKQGRELEFPVKPPKKERRVEERTILLIESGKHKLLFRRPDKGLLRGMWEPLNLVGHRDQAEIITYLQQQGSVIDGIAPLGRAKHIFSHVEWRMVGYRVQCAAPFDLPGGTWTEALEDHALPAAFRAYWHQWRE